MRDQTSQERQIKQESYHVLSRDKGRMETLTLIRSQVYMKDTFSWAMILCHNLIGMQGEGGANRFWDSRCRVQERHRKKKHNGGETDAGHNQHRQTRKKKKSTTCGLYRRQKVIAASISTRASESKAALEVTRLSRCRVNKCELLPRVCRGDRTEASQIRERTDNEFHFLHLLQILPGTRAHDGRACCRGDKGRDNQNSTVARGAHD